jgi:AcrR family transcriptional regulator
MTKHEAKCRLIIETAFSEWSKTWFKDTSLSLVHEKLKMTKPALYRYFKSKELLIEAMRDRFYEDFIANASGFSNEKPDEETGIETIKRYIRVHFTFFMNHIDYLLFFMFFIDIRSFLERPEIRELNTMETVIIGDAVNQVNPALGSVKGVATFAINYIYRTAIFIMMLESGDNRAERRKLKFPTERADSILETISTIVLQGVGSKMGLESFNPEKIEETATVSKEDLPERDKLFGAIASVVAREGLWNTTIAKIARALGITKSSLYFYFSGKIQMFEKLIISEMKRMRSLITAKCSTFQTVQEKIFGMATVLSSYLTLDTRVMLVFHWFHFQGRKIEKLDHDPDMHPGNLLFEEAISKGLLKENYTDPCWLNNFLSVHIISEVMYQGQVNDHGKDPVVFRTLFSVFNHGIVGSAG